MGIDPVLREEIHRIADTTIGEWQQALGDDDPWWASEARRLQLDFAIDALIDSSVIYIPLDVVLRNGGRP